jgi:N-acetylglucosamine kinase-like BadF-type ATPase
VYGARVWCIGLDVGGTGARGALARSGAVAATAHSDVPVHIGSEGISFEQVDRALRPVVESLLAAAGTGRVDAIAAGVTGFLMLGEDLRVRLPKALSEISGAAAVTLSSDMLTSYTGALGLNGGAVIAAGTGAVALGTDMRGTWKRVDGWGYLVGDTGGGSWLGRAGLQAALRALDGRPGGSPELLSAVEERFGDAASLVRELATRPDRAGLMAGFVPAVAAAAAGGDDVAVRLLAQAGAELAHSALAAIPADAPAVVAPTGNLFQAGEALRAAFADTVRSRAVLAEPLGTSVDGALRLAAASLTGTLPPNAPLEVTPFPR